MRVRLLFFALCLALSRAAHAADPLSEDIPVPGGATALARALGIDAVPDRARFLTDLTRVVYSAPEVTTTEALLRQLTIHVRSIAKNGRAAQAAMSKDDLVPVPLSSRTWSQAVFRRPVSTSDLFPAILGDHDAALLAHGLAALDDETLRFMNDHPALLSDLYEDGAAAFAPFAGSLHIRDNRVAVPGGAAAIPLWEAVVDQSTLTPELFVRRLFDRNDGRIAYLYDAVSQFPADTRAFALGLSITDGRLRVDRFKALAKALEAFTGWTPREQPFRRLPYDPLLVIAQVSLDEGGRPRSAGRAFWTQVFESADLSLQQLRSPRSGDPIDAAWIAESILHAGVDSQRDRIEQLTFGLRVFGSQATADAVVALRALPRYRMLMLTLERMGIADPAVHAAAARHAARLSALGPEDGFVALSQF